ncbi:MAG: SagB/ThcOx family dehydrogenase [Thermodesulfobacteriota bacterium]
MPIFWSLFLVVGIFMFFSSNGSSAEAIKLPPPATKGGMPLAEALQARRTIRHFAARPLDLAQVSQLLWEGDGLSDPRGLRTSPSAGATYPLDLYLVVGEQGVTNLPAGVYRYEVAAHALTPITKGDFRAPVARACLHQAWMTEAPVMVVITGEYRRCTARYGQRGVRYTHMESGNVSQNLFLAAEALGLGAGIVGAFDDKALAQVLKLPPAHEPLLVMPVGYKH